MSFITGQSYYFHDQLSKGMINFHSDDFYLMLCSEELNFDEDTHRSYNEVWSRQIAFVGGYAGPRLLVGLNSEKVGKIKRMSWDTIEFEGFTQGSHQGMKAFKYAFIYDNTSETKPIVAHTIFDEPVQVLTSEFFQFANPTIDIGG